MMEYYMDLLLFIYDFVESTEGRGDSKTLFSTLAERTLELITLLVVQCVGEHRK